MACNKDHSNIQNIMVNLPVDQGGRGRHKCARVRRPRPPYRPERDRAYPSSRFTSEGDRRSG